MLVFLDIVALGIVGFVIGYLLMLSLLSLFAKRLREFPVEHHRRIAVVVPAHNEERVIGKTLRSLYAVEYPSDRYEVFVVADNCSDGTSRLAREHGANVLHRSITSSRGKGYALGWCFEKLLNYDSAFEAFVVIDADSEVTPNILQVMNYYLERGSHVVQVSDIVAPHRGSWNSEMIRLGFTLYNVVRPLGRKIIGCSAGLRGNGMCFTSRVLRDVPWRAYSLTEDLEYGLMVLFNGYKVTFAPEAAVIAAMPEHASMSESQRARWETGRYPVIKAYGWKLLRASLTKKSFVLFDAWVDLITPPLVNVMCALAFMILVHLAALLFAIDSAEGLLVLWGLLFLGGILHVLVGLVSVNADTMLFRTLFLVPLYALWKVWLYVKILINGNSRQWIRTARVQFEQRPKHDSVEYR